jgi:glucose-1-phosphate cytidylyltransferase
MIPVGGRPILWHIMKGFAHYGLKDFVLCLGYKSWVIKRFFLDYALLGADFTLELGSAEQLSLHTRSSEEDWRVTLVETGQKSMTGCRVKRVEKYLSGDQFLLTYGDGVADVDIPKLLAFHRKHGKVGTLTAVQQPGRFGELDLEGQRIVEFTEKPPVTRGRINGGFYVFQRSFLDRLRDDPALVLEQAPLMDLAHDGELMAYLHDGFWHCMDSSRDCKYLNDLWNQDQVAWRVWGPPTSPRAAA